MSQEFEEPETEVEVYYNNLVPGNRVRGGLRQTPPHPRTSLEVEWDRWGWRVSRGLSPSQSQFTLFSLCLSVSSLLSLSPVRKNPLKSVTEKKLKREG